jgi:hypothetical protein
MVAAASLAAIACTAASCGGHGFSTRLRLVTWDGQTGRAYSLRCDPASGTAPHPRRICAALRRYPNLLVGGPGIDHSCPASDAFRVTGVYRSYPIDATFSPCLWVPGQGGVGPTWSELLANAGDGESASDPFPAHPLSRSERTRRLERVRRVPQLHRAELRLQRQRAAQRASGKLHLVSAGRPDALALAYLRDLTAGAGLPDGPCPAIARVYSTTQRKVERLFALRTPERNRPLYVLVFSYAYRDYTGKWHLAAGATYSVVDAETLHVKAWGAVGRWRPSGLGRATVRMP